jgi:hypothetical protein
MRAIVLGWVAGIVLVANASFAAPSAGPVGVVVDRGLHRQWVIVRDPAHPERPPRLTEVPWSDARAAQVQPGTAARTLSHRDAPLVRSGMAVEVEGYSGNAETHLRGTALQGGWNGDAVLVRAGLHGAVERCVVRGPALVEWQPGKAMN